ncbi:GSCOCG00013326001-RA-CDS [Cotesia congregata]|nr:GSCOCG00013326001-RA-CDS [Cotesia congregata]
MLHCQLPTCQSNYFWQYNQQKLLLQWVTDKYCPNKSSIHVFFHPLLNIIYFI